MTDMQDDREQQLRAREKHINTLLADAQAKHRAACNLEKENAEFLVLKDKLFGDQDQLERNRQAFEEEKRRFAAEKAKHEETMRVRELEVGKREKDLAQKQTEYEKSKRNLEIAWEQHVQKQAGLKKLLLTD